MKKPFSWLRDKPKDSDHPQIRVALKDVELNDAYLLKQVNRELQEAIARSINQAGTAGFPARPKSAFKMDVYPKLWSAQDLKDAGISGMKRRAATGHWMPDGVPVGDLYLDEGGRFWRKVSETSSPAVRRNGGVSGPSQSVQWSEMSPRDAAKYLVTPRPREELDDEEREYLRRSLGLDPEVEL